VRLLGEFDLDPCESDSQPWRCAAKGYRLGRGENGLLLPWAGRVFCNPPYGPYVGSWVERMAAHRNGILLIFNRSETKAWKRVWATGDGFLFPETRMRFRLPDGTLAKNGGGAPSALVAFGDHNALKLQTYGIAGAFLGRAHISKGVKISIL